MPTQKEIGQAHDEAREASANNSQAFIVDPTTNEVMWIEDYAGDADPAEIYYCGICYRNEG